MGRLGNDTNLVHEQYVEDEDEDEKEETTITIDTSETTTDNPSETEKTSTDGKSDADRTVQSSAVTGFECPECGRQLEENICECGFEFDATDVRSGTVSVEGASTETLLDQFGIEEDDGPKILSYPIMGTVDADNKPDLIDTLEREIGIEWDIHEVTLSATAILTSDDLADYGISASALSKKISLDEEFEINPDEPLSRQSLLSLLWDLNVPEQASLSVSLQVNKHE